MPQPQRVRNSSYSGKGGTLVTPAKVLADDERGSVRCSASNYRISGQSSSSYRNSAFCSAATYQAQPECSNVPYSISNRIDKPAWMQMSTFYGLQSRMPPTLDEPRSDFDMEVGGVINSRTSAASSPNDMDSWATSSAWKHVSVNEELNREDSEIPFGHDRYDAYPTNWWDCYIPQSSRAHGSCSRSSVVDNGTLTSMKHLRKGSSSRAPQTNDLTAPLHLDQRVSTVHKSDAKQHVPMSEPLLKGKGDSGLARHTGHSTMVNARDVQKRKSSSHGSHSCGVRPDNAGAGDTSVAGTSRCGLSNFVCSSTSDLLPSLSRSALSNLSCFSAADVLPSAPSSVTPSDRSRSRKASRALGFVDDKEAVRCGNAMKQQVQDVNIFGCPETTNAILQSQDQALSSGHLEVSRSKRPLSNRQKLSDIVTGGISSSSIGRQSLPPNYTQGVRNGAKRVGEGPRLSSRPSYPFLDGAPAFGEAGMSEEWLSWRRRSLYESESSQYCTLPSCSRFVDERPCMRPSFSAPPIRPPPLPPVAIFERSTASQDRPTAISSSTSPNVFNGSRATGAGLPGHDEGSMPSSTRLTVEGLSEILCALERVERDEELTYEQMLMLEATLLLGGMGLHDQYRDMRIDIDNMSYEELLALEERIGNVHTGLDEASVNRCVRVENFNASVACDYVPQEVDIKCSICQEEFEEGEEVGILECGHSYHCGCIKQWLSHKNQCPICKAAARVA